MTTMTKKNAMSVVCFMALCQCAAAFTSSLASYTKSNFGSELKSTSYDWMDFLKFEGQQPSFDVVEKTKQYTAESGYKQFSLKDIPTDYYDDRYVFRGPIVGPINRKDLVQTNSRFNLQQGFPDLNREPFGFCVDPENPFRVLFFERWTATHSGDWEFLGIKVEPTGEKSISPVMPFSIVWTPEGKIIYEHLTTAVDRFEGNTKGKVAVFGLFETAKLPLPDNTVGNPILRVQQKLGRKLNLPLQTFSKDEDIPSWWKGEERAADPNF